MARRTSIGHSWNRSARPRVRVSVRWRRSVSNLGLDERTRVGWEHIREILDGRSHQLDLFHPEPALPQWARVDTSRARVERLRKFGEVYLGLALWRRLQLDAFFDGAMERGREGIAWGTMACILALARFCAPSSELQIAEFWYAKTALDDLLDVPADKVNDDRLYRALDALLPHKDALFNHFQKVYGDLFGTTFDVLLYDITSTYFEGQVKGNGQAQRAAIRATSGPIACRCASPSWLRRRAYPWRMRCSTAIVPM